MAYVVLYQLFQNICRFNSTDFLLSIYCNTIFTTAPPLPIIAHKAIITILQQSHNLYIDPKISRAKNLKPSSLA